METNSQYLVIDALMAELYHDDTFNCRGPIAPMDVADLAKSVDKNGLQFPITIQPVEDVANEVLRAELVALAIKWRIIAGHRRHKACKVLGWTTVPAMIRRGLTEAQARILNLSENFDRKDLNIMQEAHALQALEASGVPRDTVAREIGKSSSWVQVRYYLLRMPEEIQQEAAAGLLNQYQIKQLYSLESPQAMFDAVKKIKEAKAKGEKPADVGQRKAKATDTKKERKRSEIFDMMWIIQTAIGNGRDTRALGWASGEITTAELFTDVARIAGEQGKRFLPPLEF